MLLGTFFGWTIGWIIGSIIGQLLIKGRGNVDWGHAIFGAVFVGTVMTLLEYWGIFTL